MPWLRHTSTVEVELKNCSRRFLFGQLCKSKHKIFLLINHVGLCKKKVTRTTTHKNLASFNVAKRAPIFFFTVGRRRDEQNFVLSRFTRCPHSTTCDAMHSKASKSKKRQTRMGLAAIIKPIFSASQPSIFVSIVNFARRDKCQRSRAADTNDLMNSANVCRLFFFLLKAA